MNAVFERQRIAKRELTVTVMDVGDSSLPVGNVCGRGRCKVSVGVEMTLRRYLFQQLLRFKPFGSNYITILPLQRRTRSYRRHAMTPADSPSADLQ